MRLVVVIAVLLVLPLSSRAQDVQEQQPLRPAPPPPEVAQACRGRWEGMAQDLNAQGRARAAPYPMALELTVETGQECGRIEYSLGCGGPLVGCTSPATNRVEALESYTHNTGCAPAGRIEVTCSADVLEFRWFETTDHYGNTTRASLRRPGAPPVVPPPPPPPGFGSGCGGCATTEATGASGALWLLVALAIGSRHRRGSRRSAEDFNGVIW